MTEMRVLLAGMTDTAASALKALLDGDGFTVVATSVDSLLATLELPGVVGAVLGPDTSPQALRAAVQHLKKASNRSVAVIGMLAGDGAQDVGAATQACVDDYVLAPHQPFEVVARLHGCMTRLRTEEEVERHKRDAAALLELSQTLSSSLSVPLILHSASRLMAQMIHVERCAIVLVDASRTEGIIVAVSEDRNIRDLRVSLARYPEIARVVETGAPLVVEDNSVDPLLKAARDQAPGVLKGTSILFPIWAEDKVGGVFFLRSGAVRAHPNEREMQFGQTVANATGVALRNARLFEGAKASTERISREHERAEERLRDLQKYESFFEDAADGMVILDGDGSVLYVNREGAQQLGGAPEKMLGQPFSTWLAPDSVDLLATVLAEVVRGRYRKTFDLYVEQGDGEKVLSCSAGAVLESGTAGRVCMISFRDATELREMETELKTTKEFLENLIDSSVDAIIAADVRGHVILFNSGAERVYGWRADEVIGKISVAQLYPDGVAQEIMVQLRSEHFGGRGKLEAMRKSIITRDGEEVPVSLTASIIYEGGEEVATVGIFTDLRERLKIEKKLVQAQERLLETEKATVAAQLAGAAAHELNQPLTSVLGYSEMLRRKIPEDSPLRRPVDIIFKEGERMADIVRKIGKITRVETKNYVGNTMIVDLDRAAGGPPSPPTPSPAVTTPPVAKRPPEGA